MFRGRPQAPHRAAVLQELDRLGPQDQPEVRIARRLTSDEVERAIRYTIGSWQIHRQTNSSQLSELLHAHLLGAGMDEIANFEARIRAVDADAIQRVAQRYFRPEVAVEAVVRGTAQKR